jgi:hypothetical protein
MSPVFHDSLLQKDFEQKGYVLIPSLLHGQDIDKLLALFTKFPAEYSGPFHTSHFSTNTEYKKQVHDLITDTVFPLAAPYFNNFLPLFGNFMIKNPDPGAAMDLHADWTYVDEFKYRSLAIWVPLVDVDAENGCFGVIEGSHKITNTIRGPLIRQSTRDHESEWEKRYGKLLPMKAGDAIFYDHALLHYSPANKTDKTRPALNLSLAPASAAPWLHYCQPEGINEIDVYKVPHPDFFIHYTHFHRPETGEIIGKIPLSNIEYIDDRMNSFWRRNLLNKIKNWF